MGARSLPLPVPYQWRSVRFSIKNDADVSPGGLATLPLDTAVYPKSVREFVDSSYRAQARNPLENVFQGSRSYGYALKQ